MDADYEGCRLFGGLAQHIGVPLDQVNFFISQLLALLLAHFYPRLTSPRTRHLYGGALGLGLLYFCYGNHTIHAVILSVLSYGIIKTQSVRYSHLVVFVFAATYMCMMHFYRIYYSYGFSGVDISGPLMVMVQKVTSLAFSIHDGATKQPEQMTAMQKKFALDRQPPPLAFFSYLLLFPSLLAGPIIYYKDYLQFIERSDGSIGYSSGRTVLKKVAISLVCCATFILLKPYFPVDRMKEDGFLDGTDFSYKLWYITICTSLARFKYYFAWIMADAICNHSGIGFNGLTAEGQAKWDKISNVDIMGFEFATSLKEAIEAWNKGTNIWLRFIAYERAPKGKVVLTYALSAIWHGFYPGYYLTFFTGAVFTQASRIVRKNIRNYFVSNPDSKKFYDFCTFIVTRFALAYATFPFILYELGATLAVYNKLYFHLHVAAALTMLLVPNCLPRSLADDAIKNKDDVKIVKAFRSGSYRID